MFVDSEDTDEVRDLFVRINSLGTPIAAADRAFARSATLDLRQMAAETLQALPPGYRTLSNEVLLQTLALAEGVKDVGERAYGQVVGRWEREARKSSIHRTRYVQRWGQLGRAISKAADYLQERFRLEVQTNSLRRYMLAQLSIFFHYHPGVPNSRQDPKFAGGFGRQDWVRGTQAEAFD